MDSRQLKAFVAVFEERNITGAARRLHLSQPALSGTIKSLEELLGTQLFTRQARGVSVTEDARILYPQARRILSQTDSMTRQFRQDSNTVRIEIGVGPDIARRDIAAFVQVTRQVLPPFFVALLEGCAGDARLTTEEERCEDELFLVLSVDPYVLAMPEDSCASAELPWIVCPDHPTHQRFLPLYGTAASAPAAHAGSLRLALELAAAGAGACVVPESLAKCQPGVRVRPVDGLDMSRRVGLCYSVQSLETPGLVRLIERFRDSTAALQ